MNDYSDQVRLFKAFCDETRLQILKLLQSGEKCACVLLAKLSIGQSTLSHHMKILVESDTVSARRDGKWTHYSINEIGCQKAIQLLGDFTTVTDPTANRNCC